MSKTALKSGSLPLDEALPHFLHGDALGLDLAGARRAGSGQARRRHRRADVGFGRGQPRLGAAAELLGAQRRHVHEQEAAFDRRPWDRLTVSARVLRLIVLHFHVGHSQSVYHGLASRGHGLYLAMKRPNHPGHQADDQGAEQGRPERGHRKPRHQGRGQAESGGIDDQIEEPERDNVNGRVNRVRTGLTTAFTNPSTSAPMARAPPVATRDTGHQVRGRGQTECDDQPVNEKQRPCVLLFTDPSLAPSLVVCASATRDGPRSRPAPRPAPRATPDQQPQLERDSGRRPPSVTVTG